MKPTKPFLLSLAALLVVGVTLASTKPAAHAATVDDAFPLSTALTPAMIDFFAVTDALVRPSFSSLVACTASPACSASDTARVRVLDASGAVLAAYDAKSTTTIEQVRHQAVTLPGGAEQTRVMVRRYTRDDRDRLVMQGSDTIVTKDAGTSTREPSTLTRVHHYSEVRFLLTDPRHLWPITGLVVLETPIPTATAARTPLQFEAHGAVSFNGTEYAQVLSNDGLTHRINLRTKRLDTSIPDR